VKIRARHSCLTALIALAVLQLSSCALTPDTFHSVILTPKGTVIVGEGASISITAQVLNDTKSNGGVTFVASPAAVGTLTQTSSTAATYVAPAAITAETVVTITATSVDFSKESSSLTVKVEPPPVITTTSLPSAPLDQPYSAPVTATGGVPPLKWTIASRSLPAGLSLASSNTDTVNITGKATTAGNSNFTVKVTDATGASSSQALNIVVSTLAFTTTSPLPPGQIGTVYNEQFAATGGTGALTFSLASGATLPAGLTLTNGDLTGTPTAAGSFSFGITVTDSGTPPASITQTFTLVINGQQNLKLLSGSYAFFFSGNNTAGYAVAAGTITADGNGNITTGEVSFNSVVGSPLTLTGITGIYTAGTDGRGTITLTNSSAGAIAPAPTYAFAIDPAGSGHGRLIEFDSSGTRGSGRLEFQTVTTCVVSNTVTNTYSGNFAFGGPGFTESTTTGAGPIALVGTFFAAPPTVPAVPGSIGPGEMDANLFGSIQPDQTLSGTWSSGADTNQCQFTFTPAFTVGPITYSAYPVSTTEAFLVETDQVTGAGATPFTSVLDMLQQFGQPFQAQNTITGPLAGGMVGTTLSGTATLLPEAAVLELSVANSGAGNFDFLFTDNTASTVTTNMAPQGGSANPLSVAYSSDQFGRVTTNIASPYNAPVLYLVSSTEAFILASTSQQSLTGQPPLFGHLTAQSAGPFDAASLKATFVEGSTAPATAAARNLSGVLTLDGISKITGTQDQSTTATNSASQAVAGTYVVFDTADGTGALTLTSPASFSGVFVIVSPTKFVFLTTTAGDTNPIVVVAGH